MTFTGPGFHVDPISIATGGRVRPDIGYEVDLTPGSPAKPTALDRARERLENRYGRDLEFPGDLVVLGDGDLALTRGLEGLRASFSRSIITSNGELFWRAGYGVGATEFLNRPHSGAIVSELQNRIRSSLVSHPAVEQLDGPTVRLGANGSLVEVETRVTVAGQSQAVGVRIRSDR